MFRTETYAQDSLYQDVGPAPLYEADEAASGLDEAHASVWDAVRQLFPAHAMVDQTDAGFLVVSWTLKGSGRGGTVFATPIMLRIDTGLLLALWTTSGIERRAIAGLQLSKVREALAGYDARERQSPLGVIVLGDELMA